MKALGRWSVHAVLICSWLFNAGCGEMTGSNDEPVGTGMTAKATIDSAGGQVELEEVAIEVPAGALPQSTEITITSTKENPKGPFKRNSPVFKFEPDGLVFNNPVKIRLKWVTTPEDTPQIFWTNGNGEFEPIGGTVGSGEVSADITHFSMGFVGTFAPNSSEPNADVPEGEIDEPLPDVPQSDLDSDAVEPGDSMPGDTTLGYRFEIQLLVDTSTPINLTPNESLEIRARVIGLPGGAPAAGQNVSFEILKVNDSKGQEVGTFDGTLDFSSVISDSDGIVAATFKAGTSCNLVYTLGLQLPGDGLAEPVSLAVVVGCEPCGCASLSLTYDGVQEGNTWEDFHVYALPSDYSCNLLSAEQPVPVDAAWGVENVESFYETPSFECLPSNVSMTMYARGYSKGSRCVVMSGCIDTVSLQPDKCQDIELKMFDAMMNTEGNYNCVDRFNFADFLTQCAGGDISQFQCAAGGEDLGKNVCCLVAETNKFFGTPGQTIIDTMNDLSAQWLGGLIPDEPALLLFQEAVATVVQDWLLNDSPSFVQDFSTFGNDMFGAISSIELTSSLTLPSMKNDFTLEGDQVWETMTLYWKKGCDPMAPGYDQCGLISLDLESLDNPLFPAALLDTTFTADIADFDKMYINQHAVPLNYGRLVLFVMNEVAVKSISGGMAGTLEEAALLWIDCQSISQGILSEVYTSFGGTRADIEALCYSAIDILLGNVDEFLSAVAQDTNLVSTSSATLVDSDCNIEADQISKGQTTGYIEGDTSQAIFTGDFACERK